MGCGASSENPPLSDTKMQLISDIRSDIKEQCLQVRTVQGKPPPLARAARLDLTAVPPRRRSKRSTRTETVRALATLAAHAAKL
jgi:hypothetical protein